MNKGEFSRTQGAWRQTASCEGFLNQYGGWDEKTGDAVILSSWVDTASISRFMAEHHGAIEAASGQPETYQNCRISYLHDVLEIPASDDKPLAAAQFIRMAYCELKPNSEQVFIDAQGSIWNPGMSSSEGMLGGTLWKDWNVRDRYLVVSLWHSRTDHQQYERDIFPVLSRSANTSEYLEKIRSYRVAVEPSWRVQSTS